MKEKGITLIALVITIIVLLILAGVSITMISGEDGIITKASNASQKTKEESQKETEALSNVSSYIDENVSGLENNINIPENALVNQVTSSNYGDTIEYTANGVTDWKIFYNDESHIYIISSKFVTSTGPDYWSSEDDFLSANASSIGSIVANRYGLSWYSSNNTSSNNNARAVADLLNTTEWSDYASGITGAEAIGAPTLEMFVKSWNAKGYSTLYCDNFNETGYYLGTESNSSDTGVSVSSLNGSSDTLYFPWTGVITGGDHVYLLASPSASSTDELYSVSRAGYIGEVLYNDNSGWVTFYSRPVVCLPTNAVATNVDGTWSGLEIAE